MSFAKQARLLFHATGDAWRLVSHPKAFLGSAKHPPLRSSDPYMLLSTSFSTRAMVKPHADCARTKLDVGARRCGGLSLERKIHGDSQRIPVGATFSFTGVRDKMNQCPLGKLFIAASPKQEASYAVQRSSLHSTMSDSQLEAIMNRRVNRDLTDANLQAFNEPPPDSLAPNTDIDGEEHRGAANKAADFHLPVRAFFIGESIDCAAFSKEFGLQCVPASAKTMVRDSVVLMLSSEQNGSYVVVFKYGSVVCINVPDEDIATHLRNARRYTTGAFDTYQSDDYKVVLRSSLEEWSAFEGDFVILKRLDMNNLRVISSVLGQTVALYHYELKVDQMLEVFSEMNSKTELTGQFSMSKRRLFRVVATLNKMMADVITKLGLLKRSDTAWNYVQYAEVDPARGQLCVGLHIWGLRLEGVHILTRASIFRVWEGLRKDFELDDRFESLGEKLAY
ncbi:hypothetical protein CYMTET_17671 [Cymbomonas tetramitiformis]|uniref:DUF155 domain-containing protein n=1 Tax=Cymbomonas tetramitiformis TaxID=36881 RepID=A0AAE0GA84_9CHLO|nr:hypothetical protein CYMTET_17671 [Cymbomonas tetramitiformis]